MTACLDVEWVGRVPKMMSQLVTRLNVECWPRAKNDESADHVLKSRVCWPRAKNDESAGYVLKCRGSFNDYNHNIQASNNAFLNHYHLLAYKKKIYFLSIIIQNQAYSCLWKIFFIIINKNQACSCLWTKAKHTRASLNQKRDLSTPQR